VGTEAKNGGGGGRIGDLNEESFWSFPPNTPGKLPTICTGLVFCLAEALERKLVVGLYLHAFRVVGEIVGRG